jgi:cytochrome c peroxidase
MPLDPSTTCRPWVLVVLGLALPGICAGGCSTAPSPEWEVANPLLPLPKPPLGIESTFESLPDPPSPARVRLGRWLFYDPRLSADGRVSCATCHRPDQGFSEVERVSTGVHGQHGTRKAPAILNLAWQVYPHFFWDGRADSLESQALGPISNPVEMGISPQQMVGILEGITAYRPYFAQAFGDAAITVERVVKAIADYERTRLAGNSAWDRWRRNGDEGAVTSQVKRGHELFFGRAACNQCHLGESLTDSLFHNLGVGWDPATSTFADEGRYAVTRNDVDRGAFKTPTLRDVSRHAPYLHDGSSKTLRDVVLLYNRGGNKNPWLSPKAQPLGLADADIDALVAFMKALDSDLPVEGHLTSFPR